MQVKINYYKEKSDSIEKMEKELNDVLIEYFEKMFKPYNRKESELSN